MRRGLGMCHAGTPHSSGKYLYFSSVFIVCTKDIRMFRRVQSRISFGLSLMDPSGKQTAQAFILSHQVFTLTVLLGFLILQHFNNNIQANSAQLSIKVYPVTEAVVSNHILQQSDTQPAKPCVSNNNNNNNNGYVCEYSFKLITCIASSQQQTVKGSTKPARHRVNKNKDLSIN